jgi:hypothetical protein
MLATFRRHVTYANVASTLALVGFVAAGAFATAAVISNDGTINGCYDKKNGDLEVRKGKKCGKGEKKISWNEKGEKGAKGNEGERGPQGVQGVAGPQGATGPAGANGTNGAPGSDATGGTMGTSTVTGGFTRVAPLGGTGGGGISTTATPGISPPRQLVMENFGARVDGLAAAESVAFTVQVDNLDTGVTCTVTAPASSCQSAQTLNLPPRTLVGLEVVTSALAGARVASWSWTFSPG